MQTPESNPSLNQTQQAQAVPATPSTAALRSWVKPTFERVPLNDAQAGGPISNFDGIASYSAS